MLKTHIIRFLAIAAGLLILLIDCSKSVSGVETGNPKMATCARIALELFDDKNAWQPSSYLVTGMAQLDTSAISARPILAQSLPKRSAGLGVNIVADSGDYLIVERTDTLIKSYRVPVTDTIINKNVIADTLTDSMWIENSADSAVIISKRLYTDSIFIMDTVEALDTFIVQRYDTLYRDSITEKFVNNRSSDIVSESSSLSPFLISTTYGALGPIIQVRGKSLSFEQIAQFKSNSINSLMSISRSSNIAGVKAFEEYIDADGDGILVEQNSSGSSKLILNASYLTNKYSLDLIVLFDAGADASFASTNDNRIHYLTRNKRINSNMTEEIIYGTGQLPSMTDTLALTVNTSFESDSVSGIFTRYCCLSGRDAFDHHQNRLSSLMHTVKYSSGNVKNIQISLTLDTLLSAGQIPSVAKVEAILNYGKGSTGVLNGIVDYRNKQVYGIYAENGTEYNYEYNYDNDSFNCKPLNE